MARHLFGGAIAYMGFGGEGLQVRDVLHLKDLYDLLAKQVTELDRHSASFYNVGGGMENSVSLCELTKFCQDFSGKRIEMGRMNETRAADIPFYVSDCTAVRRAADWKPSVS